MSVKDLPKVELHLHLEGAAPSAFVRGLAGEKKIDLAGIFDESGAYKYKDFWDFLRVYEAATSVLKSPEDYARLTRAVLETCLDSGVTYLTRFLRRAGCWCISRIPRSHSGGFGCPPSQGRYDRKR